MKHVILKPASKKGQQIMMRKRQEIHKKAFYEEKWFWFCLVLIVVCLTRPIKVIICGNDIGSNKQCH